MRQKLLVIAVLLMMIGTALSIDVNSATAGKPQELPNPGIRMRPSRDVPEYVFTVNPTSLLTSYYDYFIGGYSSLNLQTVPIQFGGGYFLSFHGRRQSNSQRRVFYGFIDSSNSITNNEITNIQNWEGFPTVVFDPVMGKPLYSWHVNVDADPQLEVQFSADAFLEEIPGLLIDPVVIIDNPVTIGTTTDNEHIWPSIQTGPSPIPGKRRVYVLARNFISHTFAPSENAYIAYTDFNTEDIEMGNPLIWNHTHIPEMHDWNTDPVTWRRPFHSFVAGEDGNLYYVGYHFAVDIDSEESIDEPAMDVFICDNYGMGTWRRVSGWDRLPSWNPPAYPGGPGYFTDDNEIPYPDDELYWGISNSSHTNAVIDSEGNIQFPALWALQNSDGFYYPTMQFVKQYVFDTVSEEFSFREVYPISDNPDDWFQPWDTEPPWGEVDEYGGTPPDQYPLIVTDWNFPYWDDTVHGNTMFFHYNHIKITESNDQQMMAVVWQNSMRARRANQFNDPEYAAFANTPEIYISISPDNGGSWSEPLSLNNQETQPQFVGIKPMWVYPASQIRYIGMQGDNKIGRLGLMFYDDYTWGSSVQTPPVGQNDGGRIMFCELEFVFPVSTNDAVTPPLAQMLHPNFPNPFNPSTTIVFTNPQTGNASLSVYNLKGQLVKTLINGTVNPGEHRVIWNGTDNSGKSVASGVYFYRLTANGRTETRKMMLMK